MGIGFYILMAAQFFSALADNALLIAAIAILRDADAPLWQIPLLKFFFTISYVVLAAFVGAFADSMAKWRVMLISNSIKIFGCSLMFFDVNPLLAYAVVGLGAAAYSPAKYGILTEMLPPSKLVVANGWIEGLTVTAIILGTLLGGLLIAPSFVQWALNFDLPLIDTGLDSAAEISIALIGVLYLIAAVFNFYVPDTGVDHKPLKRNPVYLIHEFKHCVALLWRDKLGQISLAVTTLFWGAGATLQFIVLSWAAVNLNMQLFEATKLQGVVALGVAVGSVMAACLISLRSAVRVIPLGIAMGLAVTVITQVHDTYIALGILMVIGGLAGFFVVPMNALLQHRGHVLMGAGHSIAVQNFNENIGILVMLGLYAGLVSLNVGINIIVVMFGLSIAGVMYLIKRRHAENQREFDSIAQLEDCKH